MKEPVVTIKMTLSELQLLNKMIDAHICDLDEMYQATGEGEKVSSAKMTLLKQLYNIEEWIDEEKRKAIIDKKAIEGSFDKEAEVETIKGVCIPCDT